MTQRRCLQIELVTPEPEQLRAVIHSRMEGRASPLDFFLAAVFNFLLVAIPGLFVINVAERGLLVGAAGLFALVVAVPGTAAVRKLRQRFGKPERTELAMEPASLRGQPCLRLGDRTVEASAIESVGLLGWQEVAATDRVWDVTLLSDGGSLDVVNSFHDEEGARTLAKTLATALHVELRESSTTGGAVTQVKLDQRGMPRAD